MHTHEQLSMHYNLSCTLTYLNQEYEVVHITHYQTQINLLCVNVIASAINQCLKGIPFCLSTNNRLVWKETEIQQLIHLSAYYSKSRTQNQSQQGSASARNRAQSGQLEIICRSGYFHSNQLHNKINCLLKVMKSSYSDHNVVSLTGFLIFQIDPFLFQLSFNAQPYVIHHNNFHRTNSTMSMHHTNDLQQPATPHIHVIL